MRRAPTVLLLALAAGPPLAAQQPAPARRAAPAVQVGVDVQPDTVTVGLPFVVSVRVRAPLGATVEFPPGPDSTQVVQALDPPDVRASGDTGAVDRTARYRVAAWDVGAQPMELGPIRVTLDGVPREYRVGVPGVFVSSVLPEDSTQRVPKPARQPFEFPRPWWLPWLLGLIAAAIIGLLLWWWWRRRRRAAVPPMPGLDPYQEAEARFARVEALRLLEAGERGRYVALMLEVVRDFLARRFPAASPALTSRELLVALAAERDLPLDRLAGLLHEGDLVKFARRPVTDERARAFGAECRALVQQVHDAALAAEAAPPGVQGNGRPAREPAGVGGP